MIATRTAPRAAATRAAQSGPPRLGTYPGLDRVLKQVAALIAAWRNDTRVREAALSMAVAGGQKLNARTQHADMRDFEGVAAAIYRAVVRQTVYTRDPYRSELVQAPLDTLSRGMGDCDDLVVLGGSLLAAVGVPVRVVAVGYTAPAPGTRPTRTDDGGPYEHVYLEFDPTGAGLWQAWDATLETKAGDVSPGIVLRRKVVEPVGAGSFGLADAPKGDAPTGYEFVTPATLNTARKDDGTRTPIRQLATVTQAMTVVPEGIKSDPGLLTLSQQILLARSFQQTAKVSGIELSDELARHFALAPSIPAATDRFATWLQERLAARALADRTFGTSGGSTGSTSGGSASGGSTGSTSGGGASSPDGSADAPAGGSSKTLLLVGLAGVAALVFSGGMGGPKPSGKTVRTVKTTDEKFD